jgi:hypothetical protein
MKRAVLYALRPDPLPVSSIAAQAQTGEDEARTALDELAADSLAIGEDGGYELTGPLSWFGSFEGAIAYMARKNFVVRVPGDTQTHLYLCEVRKKNGPRAGDPSNTTLCVFACGGVSAELPQVSGQGSPDCRDCRSAAGLLLRR